MNLKRAIYLVVLIMGFASPRAYSQSYTLIEDDINLYASVTAIMNVDGGNLDSVVVVDANGFDVDDTVMLYGVKGAMIGTGDPTITPGHPFYDPGEDAVLPRNAGRYGFYRITERIGNTLVINAALDDFVTMVDGDVVQLIKVRSYRNATVSGTGLWAPAWNPETGTGGIVAMFVHGVLRLDGDIDVSGAGFLGAQGSTDTEYTAGCLLGDTMSYFYRDGQVLAGLKGEGITDTMFQYNRGRASNINGGGGGNGLHAGGGGGSNFNAGVRGGDQASSCTPGDSINGGNGGFGLGRNYYRNEDNYVGNRLFFGGGGGSGTRTTTSGTTNGGNGGGIVIIIADTIFGNGGEIIANGADVAGTALDGAGAGGGGGGCIVLDVAGYQGTLPLSARGGDGGNSASTGADTLGMGGAGGGGIYWLAGDSHPGVVPDNSSTGTNGVFESVPDYDPLEASTPAYPRNDLVAPLRGFLFNPVPSEYTVCSDQDPEPIITSEPKGGAEPYTYQWIDSSSTQNFWANIPGATAKDYDPGPLSDTTYFRRIMTDNASPALVDTSFRIVVYVHLAITGNTIAAADTVCSGNTPELFVSSATIGGGPTGGSYTYKWQHLPEGAGSYTDITSVTGEPTYQAPELTATTDYRRIAYSGVCIDTSTDERVRVLETITGNAITPYDTICVNTAPDLISGPLPSDGDQDDIRYQWITSNDPGLMGTVISGATGIGYQSPALSQTTYFRRVVLSGNDDACRDTSAYVEILNVPAITGNTISVSQTLCQEDQAALLTGNSPGGGYLDLYSYTWISSTDQSSWIPATGPGDNDVMTGFDPGVMSGDTTWYRRVVGSGGQELVCKDTSLVPVVINVIPSITNNVLSPEDDLKCQLDMPDAINGSLPGGGATAEGYDPVYRWEVAKVNGIPGSGDWVYPSAGADGQNYTDPDQLALDVDRWYRRIVTSGPTGECSSISDTVHLVVHTGITANAIDAAQAICFNDATGPPLRHDTLTGGENGISPVYTWRYWLEGQTPGDAVDIPASDDQQYAPAPFTNPSTLVYFYDRVVAIGACLDTSNAMQLTVMQLPGGQLTDEDADLCEQEIVLHLDLNMADLNPVHYFTPWEVYLKDGVHTGTEIGPGLVYEDMDTMGITLDTEETDHVTYTYEIESIRYNPEPEEGNTYFCISSVAELPPSPVVIQVSLQPEPSIQADVAEVCNTTATLEMDSDNGTLTYWSEPAGSVFFSPGSGPNEYQVSIPNNPDDFGEYRIFARSEVGDCAGEDSIDLHFFEEPAPADAGDQIADIFLTKQAQLRADPPTAGYGTWTLEDGFGRFVDENDPNTLAFDLDYGENTFLWTVRNGVCESSDDFTIVRRNEVKRYNGFSPNGDMSNEYYILQGLVYADEFSITFLNSLGSIVRTIDQDNYAELLENIDESLIIDLKEDEMVIWDGRADNGNQVASGTYYFVLTFKFGEDDPYEFKDYVVVIVE